MHLLVDLRHPRGASSAAKLEALLQALPGVISAHVDRAADQAAVIMDSETSLTPNDLQTRLQNAGYHVRVCRVPDRDEDSDYARYYHAAPESPEAWWFT